MLECFCSVGRQPRERRRRDVPQAAGFDRAAVLPQPRSLDRRDAQRDRAQRVVLQHRADDRRVRAQGVYALKQARC